MHFKDLIKILKEDGWTIKDQKGSHIQLTHPTKSGKITVPAHGKKDIKIGTFNAILKQAGLK